MSLLETEPLLPSDRPPGSSSTATYPAPRAALDDEETARLDEVSAPRSNDYPYGPFGVKQRDRYVDSIDQAIAKPF